MSSPIIKLPQVPNNLDPELRDYLLNINKILIKKQNEEYGENEKTIAELKSDIEDLSTYINDTICVWQIVDNHVTMPYTYAYTATRASAVELACLTTSIITKRDNTRISFDALINGEIFHESALILERVIDGVATEIGSHSDPNVGVRCYGIIGSTYDVDYDTTMNQNKIQYIDAPEVSSGTEITYKIKIYGSANTARINRTVGDGNITTRERGTSNVRLQEIK